MLQNSDLKALTILRQLSRDQSSMNQVTHLLNIAFDLAEEFKIIYRRLK
jgi:ribulose bisphosphate carboxylase small subunit